MVLCLQWELVVKEGVLSLMMLIQQTCHYIPSLLHCAVLLSVQCLQSVDQLHPELLLLGSAICCIS